MAWPVTRGVRTGVLFAFVPVLTLMSSAASAEQSGWTVVWQDEFDGDALDPEKWQPEESCWGGGNDERQCYTAQPENIRVRDGKLALTAFEGEVSGPLYPPELRGDEGETRTQPYSSGKVRTKGLADWRYGRFSARMLLPEGQGTWPAFWMMPAAAAYGRWPLSGEIDIMEAVNLATPCDECEGGRERRTSGAVHFGAIPPGNRYLTSKTDAHEGTTPSAGWHTYAVEWGEGLISWFVDGNLFMQVTEEDWFTTASAEAAAPFDEPFYLMLNLAAGGRLPEDDNGAGFDPESFPATLLVDWVRVEQCEADPQTGRACMAPPDWDGTLEAGPSPQTKDKN